MSHDFSALLTSIPDFPQPGVTFKDISPLLLQAFPQFIDAMSDSVADWSQIDAVAGIEARGFPFASALAYKHGKGFVMLRKVGKLPPPTVRASYKLEYGEATLEAKAGEGRLLIVDDVLATGGTMCAAFDLTRKAGYEHMSSISALRLSFLNPVLPDGAAHDWILDL
jgi:adenine phosphoribosyltransferase